MTNSYWIDSASLPEFPKLEENIDAQVCIIGAGITGLSTGYYLAKNGFKVCILEKGKVANHATR